MDADAAIEPTREAVEGLELGSELASASRSDRLFDWLLGWNWERTVSATIVALASGLLFWAMRPDLLFANTTPAGGDMGAHVWGPVFLRDHLLPEGRLSGWTPDWYAGFPAYHFYMVIPSLLILALDLVLPYGIAFKLVTVAGIVSLPVAGWAFGRLSDMPFPGPPLCAVATLPFLLDRSYSIWGGNIASTMAGEFAYSLGLSLAVLYLGFAVRGLRTGKHRGLAAVLLALCGLTHIIPAFFAIGVSALLLAFHFRVSSVFRWALPVSLVAGLVSAFWILPFYLRQDYLNDMGWERTDQYFTWLVPNTDMQWVQLFAIAGFILSVATRRRIGVVLTLAAFGIGAAFMVLPQARLWNARILPFYYLTLCLLAALGAALMVRAVAGGASLLFSADGSSRRPRQLVSASLPLLVAWVIVLDEFALGGWDAERLVHVVAWIIETPAQFLLGTTTVVDDADVPRLAQQLAVVAARVAWTGVILIVVELIRMLVAVYRPGPARITSLRSVRLGGASLAAIAVLFVAWLPLNLRFDVLGLRGGEEISRVTVNENDPENPDDDESITEYFVQALGMEASAHFVDGWVAWNYSGYERKDAYPEYHAVVSMMAQVGETNGCGRAMWEYDSDLNRFGTPMALMLLPHWTDGCIGSMEGLYFEASATTPYHFINQTELSATPSSAQRDLPYMGFDIDSGVRHLQQMGVRYYMAFTPQAVAAADAHQSLTLVDDVGSWRVYEVAQSELVEALAGLPVVLDGISNHNDEWLAPAMASYLDVEGLYTPLAADGPADWPRANADDVIRYTFDPAAEGSPEIGTGEALQSVAGLNNDAVPFEAVGDAQAIDIQTGTDTISFTVDQVGVPMLVKASYFPNWKASGADGPYRVAPNLMVVVPTDTEVTLTYGRTGVDMLGWFLTLVGLAGVLVLARNWIPSMPALARDRGGIGEDDSGPMLRPGADPHRDDVEGSVLRIVERTHAAPGVVESPAVYPEAAGPAPPAPLVPPEPAAPLVPPEPAGAPEWIREAAAESAATQPAIAEARVSDPASKVEPSGPTSGAPIDGAPAGSGRFRVARRGDLAHRSDGPILVPIETPDRSTHDPLGRDANSELAPGVLSSPGLLGGERDEAGGATNRDPGSENDDSSP